MAVDVQVPTRPAAVREDRALGETEGAESATTGSGPFRFTSVCGVRTLTGAMAPHRHGPAARVAGVLTGLLLVSAVARADVTLMREVLRETTTFTDQTLRTRGTERIRIRGDAVRLDDLMLGQSLVVRLDRKELIHLNHLRRTASALPLKTLECRREAVLGGIKAARERAAETTDAARLDAVLRGFGLYPAPPRVERRTTGDRATIAGRDAVRVRFDVEGETRLDLWLFAGGPESRTYGDALAALFAVPPAVADAMRQFPGLPLREESRYAWFLDRIRVTAEATAIEIADVPVSEFAPPADYRDAPFALLPDDSPPMLPAVPPENP